MVGNIKTAFSLYYSNELQEYQEFPRLVVAAQFNIQKCEWLTSKMH